jgi:hypothetical protein
MGRSTSKEKANHSDGAAIPTDPPENLSMVELERALEIELRHLRTLLREVAANYISALEADIEQVVEALGAADQRPMKDSQIRRAEFRNMLDRIRALRVKPQKGRRRDMKRMDKLIGELAEWADRRMEEH